MSGDYIETIDMLVEIQANGIIRDKTNLSIIGHMNNMDEFEKLKLLPNDFVSYEIDEMGHILNCFDNLFYIHEQPKEVQEEWLEIIHKACADARKKWSEAVKNSEA